MPRRGSSKPPAEPVVKPYGCDLNQVHSGKLYKLNNEIVDYSAEVNFN